MGFVHPQKASITDSMAGPLRPGAAAAQAVAYVPQRRGVDWELPAECGQRVDDGPLWRV